MINPTLLAKILLVFKELSVFRRIFVTGPQRSGTTICARIIQEETSFRYIDEEDFGIHLPGELIAFLGEDERIVVQCPGVSRWIHEIATNGDIVIWMRRPTEEILASQKRINWSTANERAKYRDIIHDFSRPISEIKNEYWVQQRRVVPKYLEVTYESLTNHKLFIQNREGFENRQWKTR